VHGSLRPLTILPAAYFSGLTDGGMKAVLYASNFGNVTKGDRSLWEACVGRTSQYGQSVSSMSLRIQ
jgi:hypothetical protein